MAQTQIEDTENLIKFIKKYSQDFEICKKSLVSPTFQSVCQIYGEIVRRFEENFCELIAENTIMWGEPAELQNFEAEVQLYWKISLMSKRVFKIYLSDIYQPLPKRTRTIVKILINFLIFIEFNILGPGSNLVNEVYKKQEIHHKLDSEKCSLLEEICETSIQIHKSQENHEKLKEESINIEKIYKEMQDKKLKHNNAIAALKEEIERLQIEANNYDFEVKHQEELERSLQKKTVTEAEYQGLLKMKQSLDDEIGSLIENVEHIVDGLDNEKAIVEQDEDYLKILENLVFETDKLKLYQEQVNHLKSKTLEITTLQEKLKEFRCTKNNENDTQILESKLNYTLVEEDKVKEQFKAAMNQMDQEYRKLTTQLMERFTELSHKMLQLESEIINIENNKIKLKNAFTITYKKVLDCERDVITTFHSKLMKR